MAYAVGDTINTSILLAGGETGQVAADFDTLTAYLLPTAIPTATVTLTEIGDGRYGLSFVPSEAGEWEVVAVFGGDTYDASFDVDEADTFVSPITVWVSTGQTTLKEMRRRVGILVGDLTTLTATSASASGQTFTDANNLYLPNNNYTARWAWAATGANAGLQRFVASSSYGSRSLTFDPTFPSAFAPGDEIDLTNERGVGFRPDQIHGAVNAGVQDAAAMGGVPISAILAGVWSQATASIALPDEFATVDAVAYENQDGMWRTIAAAPNWDGAGWWVGRDGAVLELIGFPSATADGGRIRVWGTGRPAPLTADADTTAVNAEWLEAFAAARLMLAGLRQEPARGPLLNLYEGKARALKQQAVPISANESVWTRT